MRDLRPLYVAAILTWAAGIVDAVGFISLGGIYTANMSGNSIAIGIQGTRHNWPEFLAHGWPVLMYFVGLLFCRLLIEFAGRKKIASIATVTLGIEVCMLLPVAVLSGRPGHVAPDLQVAYVALLALAMGVQNAALTHFSNLTLHTGFVTGTLLKAAQHAAGFFTWLHDESGRSGAIHALSQSAKHREFRHSAYLILVWMIYVTGAAFGTFAVFKYSFRTLFVVIGTLTVVTGMDLKRPLANNEVQDQAAQSA